MPRGFCSSTPSRGPGLAGQLLLQDCQGPQRHRQTVGITDRQLELQMRQQQLQINTVWDIPGYGSSRERKGTEGKGRP